MFPIEIPPGTTTRAFFTRLVPELHARLVRDAAPAAKEELHAVVRLEGGDSFTYAIRGAQMTVTEGERDGASIWLSVAHDTVERFLADWSGPVQVARAHSSPSSESGPKKYFPRFTPAGELVALSDPRVLKRLAMVSGRIELALVDFEGERVSMVAGFGAEARKGIDTFEPDAVIELRTKTYEKILDGKLKPEDALADGDVVQRGKKMLAMQLALAVAPFFPVRG